MRISIEVNWKTVVALGFSGAGIFCIAKMPSDAIERVLTHAVDALSACTSKLLSGN